MTTATTGLSGMSAQRRRVLPGPEQWTEAMVPGTARARRHHRPHRPALAGHPLHAQRVPGEGDRADVRVLGKASGVSIKELYQLFPKGPAKIAAQASPASQSPAAASDKEK